MLIRVKNSLLKHFKIKKKIKWHQTKSQMGFFFISLTCSEYCFHRSATVGHVVRRQQTFLYTVCLIRDPFRGHDVSEEEEEDDEEHADDVIVLYLAVLPQHTLEESWQQHSVRYLVPLFDLAGTRRRRSIRLQQGAESMGTDLFTWGS